MHEGVLFLFFLMPKNGISKIDRLKNWIVWQITKKLENNMKIFSTDALDNYMGGIIGSKWSFSSKFWICRQIFRKLNDKPCLHEYFQLN
jgi:hypothetical protein